MLAAGMGGFAWWIYYRREVPVPGRPLLLAARVIAILGLAAMLWNPELPSGSSNGGSPRWVLLDGSRSMAASAVDGDGRLWDAALTRTQALANDGYRILLADDDAKAVSPDALSGLEPVGAQSSLSAALTIAAEAGAREVRVVTDRRISDPLAFKDAARRLGVRVDVEQLPEMAANLGLDRVLVPNAVTAGEVATVRVEIRGDSEEDSVEVTLRLDGEFVAGGRVLAPQGGGIAVSEWSVQPGAAQGIRRLVVGLDHTDAFAADNERVVNLNVDPEETGILLVSFQPDWEPRFLFSVLGEVTGLPTQAYVRTGPDRYMPLDQTGGQELDEAGLLRRAGRSELLVLLGVDREAATLLRGAVSRAHRLLLFPEGPEGAALVGLDVAGRQYGEWYVGELPASPIAGGLGGVLPDDLPPLSSVLPLREAQGGAGIHVRLQGSGDPLPGLILRTQGRQKQAVALASGTWRWAARGGGPRESYRRLWSSVGGWLLAEAPLVAGPGLRPRRSIEGQGAVQEWLAQGYEGDTVALVLRDGEGAVVLDTALTVPAAGQFSLPAQRPGVYRFEASVLGIDVGEEEGSDSTEISGQFEIETYSDEVFRQAVSADLLESVGGSLEDTPGHRRPLRTSPFPYLLLLAVLCGEWAGRRRLGLR